MTQKELLDLLMLRLAHRTNPELREAAALEFKLKQESFEKAGDFRPWFLLQEYTDAAFKTVAGSPVVALPTGFLGLEEDLDPFMYYRDPSLEEPDNWKPLTHVSNWERPAGTDKPRAFTIVGSSLRLSPVPDAEYDLKLWAYFRTPDFVDANESTLWTENAAEWLLNAAMAEVAAKHVGDTAVAQMALAQAQAAKTLVYNQTISRLAQGQQMTMGEP